jgi:multisubunit Na+/H+ antiporter MnhB subunit
MFPVLGRETPSESVRGLLFWTSRMPGLIAFLIGGASLGLLWIQVYRSRKKKPKQGMWSFGAAIGAVAGFLMWIVWHMQ